MLKILYNIYIKKLIRFRSYILYQTLDSRNEWVFKGHNYYNFINFRYFTIVVFLITNSLCFYLNINIIIIRYKIPYFNIFMTIYIPNKCQIIKKFKVFPSFINSYTLLSFKTVSSLNFINNFDCEFNYFIS